MTKKDDTTELQTIEEQNLSNVESSEIEQAFQEANDFRSIGEKITAPLDDIITQTAEIIDRDPIMNVSGELAQMNNEVQEVYGKIINNDGVVMRFFKALPILGGLANIVDKKIEDANFNIRGLEGKIALIFSGFDTTYDSVNTSIDLQKTFLDGIDENLGKVEAYKEFIEQKTVDFQERLSQSTDEDEQHKLRLFIRNVEFFQGNLVVLIGNLDMARKRLLMRLDSATKLSLAMSSSRPIFKTLLSTAIIETSSQKAIDASMEAMQAMGDTIDKMSTELTDKAIDSNKRTEEITSKPILQASVFIQNVAKLKNYFDEIDTYREQMKQEADAERKLFTEAEEKLRNIKMLNKKDTEEFNKELLEAA